MTRASKQAGVNVLDAVVASLNAVGYAIVMTRPDDACERCGCLMGDHLGVLSAEPTGDPAVDRIGWIECAHHNTTCDTWAITPHRA